MELAKQYDMELHITAIGYGASKAIGYGAITAIGYGAITAI